jgi:hypothetical protein
MAAHRSNRPKEVSLDELLEQGDRTRRREVTPQNDPGLRDGNSGRGDVDWDAEDEITTDNDVGDTADTGEPIAGVSGGAVGGTPAGGRTVEHVTHGLTPDSDKRGDSTIGSKPMGA